MNLADLDGFFYALLGPGAGIDVVGGERFSVEVQWRHIELERRSPLQEKNLVIVGDVHQAAQVCLRSEDDFLIHRAPVTHFHDGHAVLAVAEQLRGGSLQNGLRHDGGTRRKVIHSVAHDRLLFPWRV